MLAENDHSNNQIYLGRNFTLAAEFLTHAAVWRCCWMPEHCVNVFVFRANCGLEKTQRAAHVPLSLALRPNRQYRYGAALSLGQAPSCSMCFAYFAQGILIPA